MDQDYEVSLAVKDTHAALAASPSVARAMAFLKDDEQRRLEEQIEIARIPAPSYDEGRRAQDMSRRFEALGLSDVHIDRFGNVIGVRRGTGSGKRIVIDAHTDTVFAADTKLEPTREGNIVRMPGINDDASGLAAMLSIIRAMNAAGIETGGDLIFCGIVEEEVGVKGMAKFVGDNTFDACISLDCDGEGYFVYGSMGRKVVEITFKGTAGSIGYGSVSHAIYAAARAMVAISGMPVRDGTVLAVNGMNAAESSRGKACDKAVVNVELRALRQQDLDEMLGQVRQAVRGACELENCRPFIKPKLPPPPIMVTSSPQQEAKERVAHSIDITDDTEAAWQNPHNPLLESLYTIYQGMGISEPKRIASANSNSAEAIRAGIQGLTMGVGGIGGGVHSLDEYFDATDMYRGAQAAMMLALMMAGVKDITLPLA